MTMIFLMLILKNFFTDQTRDSKYFKRLYPTNIAKTKNIKVDDYTRNSKSEFFTDLWHRLEKSSPFLFPIIQRDTFTATDTAIQIYRYIHI